jgi:hypothetical protein
MITNNLNPRKVGDIANGFNVALGNEDPAEADAETLEAYRLDFVKWIETIAKPAADGLIEVHRATGIDLKNWEPVLRFVQSVRPEFSIEGEPEW